MQLSVVELHQIQRAAHMEGVEAAMDEVCHQLPSMIDEAVKIGVEAQAKARKAAATKPAYPSRRGARKPVRQA